MTTGAIAGAVAAVVLLGTSQARADEYWFVGYSQDLGTMVFVDTETIVIREPGVKSAWITQVYEGPELPKHYGTKYEKILGYFNCTSNLVSFKDDVAYSHEGDVVNSWVQNPPNWEDIVPDSLGEMEKDFICAPPRARAGIFGVVKAGVPPIQFSDTYYAGMTLPSTH